MQTSSNADNKISISFCCEPIPNKNKSPFPRSASGKIPLLMSNSCSFSESQALCLIKISVAMVPPPSRGRHPETVPALGAESHRLSPWPISEWPVIRPEQSARMLQSTRWRLFAHVDCFRIAEDQTEPRSAARSRVAAPCLIASYQVEALHSRGTNSGQSE